MTTGDHLTIKAADKTDALTIGTLAHAVWPHAYQDILNKPQLDYMLDLFYSPKAIEAQLEQGHHFYIASISSEPVGFISFSHDNIAGTFKIQKLYVHPLVHGKGVGGRLMNVAIQEAKKHHAHALRLNVNRQNSAKEFYTRLGFAICGEEDIAIGEGYFMNDYVMEKKL